MSFTLTREHAAAIFDPVNEGNRAAFADALDPEVRWVVASENKDPMRLTGIYNKASWYAEVMAALAARLDNNKAKIVSVEVVNNKAIVEGVGEATQKNGKPYYNRFALFFKFSSETGKIVEVNEYVDTAMLQEVMQTNPL
ncbi:hypothetical protein FB45DRAFT_928027 [Roridomyces roridus]|uniref:SnoaL-like domain-containing protein n=1 Tax=Roridomyces roridus TaxID=1738132 RepID=A0AAD7BGX1_9AGAR|nr:hypothetical protein FB45DRAFT_928027 [Roridomyces roridus]